MLIRDADIPAMEAGKMILRDVRNSVVKIINVARGNQDLAIVCCIGSNGKRPEERHEHNGKECRAEVKQCPFGTQPMDLAGFEVRMAKRRS